MPMLKDSAFIL